jgi:predicted aconitase with swiveling domain
MNTGDDDTLVLTGRSVVDGVAEGEAFVTTQTISGFGGIDPMTGTITERRHEMVGKSFAGKVLVFRGAKGSSGWASNFQTARLAGAGPVAVIFNELTTKMALGAVVMRVPAMTDLDQNPLEVIRNGDWVKVDANRGIVEVSRKTDK